MNLTTIQERIHIIRDQKVMLDFDLAALYEVETKVLNLAVKRNIQRFPDDFMFQLTQTEWEEINLRFQFETSSSTHGGRRYLPKAFTEQGLAMLSGVLKSDKAIAVNIQIMRAFVELRRFALTYDELAKRLFALEGNYHDVYDALKFLLQQNDQVESTDTRRKIGYESTQR